jgi:hypothetical protein
VDTLLLGCLPDTLEVLRLIGSTIRFTPFAAPALRWLSLDGAVDSPPFAAALPALVELVLNNIAVDADLFDRCPRLLYVHLNLCSVPADWFAHVLASPRVGSIELRCYRSLDDRHLAYLAANADRVARLAKLKLWRGDFSSETREPLIALLPRNVDV